MNDEMLQLPHRLCLEANRAQLQNRTVLDHQHNMQTHRLPRPILRSVTPLILRILRHILRLPMLTRRSLHPLCLLKERP